MYIRSRVTVGVLQVTILLMASLAMGCGEKGGHVSGKVTFKGQPVPSGKVFIMPDASKGNSGSTGFADIKDGAYNTSAAGGRAAPSGHVIFALEGIDPNPPPNADPDVTATVLFARYEMKAELPESGSVIDIDVPDEAALGPPQQQERPVVVP